jgi:D-alanyl-D-alanine carboxypeptidase/D-alanyl-D-alanine carboxypeptidase (penicillin-binding protein 5/6)
MKARGFLFSIISIITVFMLTVTPVTCFAGSEAAGPSVADSRTADSKAVGSKTADSRTSASNAVDSKTAVSNTAGSAAANTDTGTGNTGAENVGYGAATRVPSPEISAPSAILVEAETGQVLYHKNSETPLHISAACKLMTVLVAVENSSPSSYVTVSSDSVDTEGSALNLEVGAKYLMSDLLYAVMLTSANDAAVAVAESVSSGDINKFVGLMNETAEKIGMTQTHFSNPTGLYDETQYTTARDLSLLVKYAIKIPQFNNIYSSKVKLWYDASNTPRILTSSNQLFWSYDGLTGGKIGYNNKDQQSVISTASRKNMKLIGIVLDAPEQAMYTDTSALLDYGFNNFWKSTLVSKNELIKTVEFEGNQVKLVSQSDIMYIHPIGESYIKEFEATADIKPPLKRTIPAGSATYVLGDGTEVSISLYPESEIIPVEDTKTRIQKKINENRDIFLIVAVLLAIEAILLLFNVGKLFAKLVSFIARRIKRST